jgi:hypothetical protein
MTEQIGIDGRFSVAFTQIGARRNPGDPHLTHIPLHPFAIDRPKLLLHQDGQLARAIKGMGGREFVNAVFDRHLLWRWRLRLIVQATAADPQQLGLNLERQGIRLVVNCCPSLGMA